MKTCPKCKTAGLPDEAKFCPNCGASLTPVESAKRMTISECRLVPNTIKNGDRCKLVWKGDNVDSITIEGRIYKPNDDIVLSPIQSYVYNVSFKGKDGKQIVDQVSVTIQQPRVSIAQDDQEIKFLYGDKGKISSLKGRLLVDIRQCKRTSGLGWDGKYEFSPGLPIGFTGFYAIFDQSEDIQVLIDNGTLSCIFFVYGEYTVKGWRGEERETYYELEEGWFSSEYVPKYRYNTVTYIGLFKNGVLIPKGSNEYKEAENKVGDALYSIMEKCEKVYLKEFGSFFGVTWDVFWDGAEDYEVNDD